MKRKALGVVIVGGMLVTSMAWAAPVRHSGTVAAINPAAGSMTLEEMGPWKGPGTRPFDRTVRLGPRTTVTQVERARGAAPDGWMHGYVSLSRTVSDVHAGDWVTVTMSNAGGNTASAVTIVRPTIG